MAMSNKCIDKKLCFVFFFIFPGGALLRTTKRHISGNVLRMCIGCNTVEGSVDQPSCAECVND